MSSIGNKLLLTPRSASEEVVSLLAQRHGLALASLFPSGTPTDNGTHAVLLDGPRGSFAVSTGSRVNSLEASSWAWSANLPHHVLINEDHVHVTRWDQPYAHVELTRRELNDDPDAFFDFLRKDRVQDARTVVRHAVELFRRVRSAVQQSNLPDAFAMTAYLTVLATLNGSRSLEDSDYGRLGKIYALPNNYRDIMSRLPERAIAGTIRDFSQLQIGQHTLDAYPVLAMRHASGAIFQEAHYNLLESDRQLALFDDLTPARASSTRRGVVHFTPPPLARGLAEQALERVRNLHSRTTLVVADITCGSGAFLIECLRTLERMRYGGRISIYGRDISPVAVDMARFAVGLTVAEWPGSHRCDIDIDVQDTLREPPQVDADVMVMNPPFLAWQMQDGSTREVLRNILSDAWAGRPDVSTGFILRAVETLRSDGVLAALVPASVLETKAGSRWRARLGERHAPALVARFDNLSIFSHATIRLGAIILGGEASETLEVRGGPTQDAVGDVLRALRRGIRGDDSTANAPATWAIRATDTSLRVAPGQIADDRAWWVGSSRTVPLNHLFKIHQGIRTGHNPAFVLTPAQHRALPREEQTAFRPAITSDDIVAGRASTRVMIFYPYATPWDDIASEPDLRRRLPTYAERYLMPAREKLRQRPGFYDRWWLLTRPRDKGLARSRPLFVTKYFAEPGGIALDVERDALVLQGFGWTPTSHAKTAMAENYSNASSAKIFAYLAILNSQAFFEIVAANSNSQRGGQFDMSHRYIQTLPLIDLNDIPLYEQHIIDILANAGRAIHSGEQKHLSNSALEYVEHAVKDLYLGLDRASMLTSHKEDRENNLPIWLTRFINAEKNPLNRKQRVTVLLDLRQRAKAGAFEEIDHALLHVDVSELNDYALTTLLRGTFAMRLHLSCWTDFRNRVATILEARGRNLPVVMVGLD